MSRLPMLEVPDSSIDVLYSEGSIWVPGVEPENQYMVIRSTSDTKKSALVCRRGDDLFKIGKGRTPLGISTRDAQQVAFLDSLYQEDILVSVGIGRAGTGKSTLALAYALDRFEKEKIPIIVTRPAVYVGQAKAFGPIPGDISEKMAPFLDSFKIILTKLMGEKAKCYVELMIKKGDIKFLPIEFMRGCSFDRCTVLIDESQNTSWHELNSTCSRVGENAKLILLGDPNQVDIKCAKTETGLARLLSSETFKASKITSCVTLSEQYRSAIAGLMNDIDSELNGNIEL